MNNDLSTGSSDGLLENTAGSVIPDTEINENGPTQTLPEGDEAALPGDTVPKKKNRRMIVILSAAAAILAAVIGLVASLAGRYDPDKLVGEWVEERDGLAEFVFYENGSGKIAGDLDELDLAWLDGLPFNWHTDKNRLTLGFNILFYTQELDFEFEIKGGKLYLSFLYEGETDDEDIILRKKKKSDEKKADTLADTTAADLTQETTEESTGEENVDYSDSVGIVNRIWFHRPYYNAWTHLVIVKNKSDKALSVSTSSLAYDEEKNLLGSANGDAVIVPPGYTSYVEETFYIDEDVDDFKTVVKAVAADPDESVLQDVECKADKTLTGVVLTISNVGESAIDSVEGYVAFYLDGDFVDVAPMSVDSLGVGESKFDQVDCDEEEFDSVKYYLAASR